MYARSKNQDLRYKLITLTTLYSPGPGVKITGGPVSRCDTDQRPPLAFCCGRLYAPGPGTDHRLCDHHKTRQNLQIMLPQTWHRLTSPDRTLLARSRSTTAAVSARLAAVAARRPKFCLDDEPREDTSLSINGNLTVFSSVLWRP